MVPAAVKLWATILLLPPSFGEVLCAERSSSCQLPVLFTYQKPCLLTKNRQKCALPRSSMTCWVVRADGPGLGFVWSQIFPLHNNDNFSWRMVAWGRYLCFISGFCSLCVFSGVLQRCDRRKCSLGQKPAMEYGGKNGKADLGQPIWR